MSGPDTAPGGGVDPGLRALVRLSAAVALGADQDLHPFLRDAARWAEVREVEEALLQSYLFLGYPAALSALAGWRRVSGEDPPSMVREDLEMWYRRGEAVCREVYGAAYPGLRENISGLSRDLDLWMVQEGYGKVLGRPGLALWRRECCIAAILTVLGTTPQLRSHLRGALRTGTDVGVVEAVLDEVLDLTPPGRRERAREVWADVRARWEET